MSLSRFKLDSGGIQSYLDGEHGVAELLRKEAESAADRARASAPVESGEYRDSIHIEETHTDRLVLRVVADAPHALVVEANTGNMARALP